jgi:hypothetical protein
MLQVYRVRTNILGAAPCRYSCKSSRKSPVGVPVLVTLEDATHRISPFIEPPLRSVSE